MTVRKRLANRRLAETFTFEVAGLRYTCTVGRFPDGSIGELFLSNHKSNSAADTNARDAAITFSIAVQHGADAEVIRRALCRDANGRASGPLGAALTYIADQGQCDDRGNPAVPRLSRLHRPRGPRLAGDLSRSWLVARRSRRCLGERLLARKEPRRFDYRPQRGRTLRHRAPTEGDANAIR